MSGELGEILKERRIAVKLEDSALQTNLWTKKNNIFEQKGVFVRETVFILLNYP